MTTTSLVLLLLNLRHSVSQTLDIYILGTNRQDKDEVLKNDHSRNKCIYRCVAPVHAHNSAERWSSWYGVWSPIRVLYISKCSEHVRRSVCDNGCTDARMINTHPGSSNDFPCHTWNIRAPYINTTLACTRPHCAAECAFDLMFHIILRVVSRCRNNCITALGAF